MRVMIDLPILNQLGFALSQWMIVRAEIVDIDVPGATFAVHRDIHHMDHWSVSNIETGMGVCSRQRIRKAAIDAATRNCAKYSSRFPAILEKKLQHLGRSVMDGRCAWM